MTSYSTPYYDPPVRFREVVTRADIDALVARGQTSLMLGERGTITDEAREHALNLGIAIQHGDRKASTAPRTPSAPPHPSMPGGVTQTGIIEAVAAELQGRGIDPAAALIQQVVAGVNEALKAIRP